ncbi:MAG TPA: AAA family ATPase [Gemmatimonadales bacterium]|nr:AAA family ATPase [Gemmatimonadales bacterium]
MTGLSLQLFGPPTVTSSSGPPPIGAGGTKALALLAYLALEPGRHTREELAAFLWGDSSEAAARASLRQTLKRLRAVSGESLDIDRTSVELRGGGVMQCDVHRFLHAAEHDPARAAAFDVPRFLAGFALRHAPAFDEWVARKRQHLMQQFCDALRGLAQQAVEQSRWREAVELAERWAACDPLSEEAARLAIECRYLMGDRAAALARYQQFRERLARDIGVEPGSALTALAARLETAAGQSPSVQPHPAPETSGPTLEAGLIGRGGAWQQLREVWRAVSQNAGRVVLLEGEAGIGKSRLAEEFLHWTLAEGATVLRGRAYHPTAGMPYGPLIEALRGALDAPGIAGTDPEWLAEAARLLPELRRRFPALPDLPAPAAAGDRWRLYEAVVQLLLALAAERPLVLCIDDLQWADPETSALLHFVGRRIEHAPVGLVLTRTLGDVPRDAPSGRLARVLHAQSYAVVITLSPLTEEEVWRLVRELGRITAPGGGRRLAHRLYEVTDGNPFYVIELIKTLFAQGLLSVDPVTGSWRPAATDTGSFAGLQLPATVRDAIGERVESLPYEMRDLLATVAVAGRARAGLISHTQGISRLRAAALADALVERRLLVEEQGLYHCAHPVIADVVREGLTPARRRELHRAIALALETIASPAESQEVAGDIAWHAERGGERALAFRHALTASAAAVSRYAFEEAAAWLDLAAGVAAPGAETDEVNRRTAEVLQLAGWSETPPLPVRSSSAARRIDPLDLDFGPADSPTPAA